MRVRCQSAICPVRDSYSFLVLLNIQPFFTEEYFALQKPRDR